MKTVAVHMHLSEAEAEKAFLESQGIRVFLKNASVMAATHIWGEAGMEGVEVQVAERDFDRAVILLRENGGGEDLEYFEDLVKKEFPDLEWENVEHVSHGWDHDVLILDGKYVFRFPRRHERYVEKLSDEIELVKFLGERLSARIPVYKFIARGRGFAGYESVGGQPMNDVGFGELSEVQKEDVARDLGEFLTQLHGIGIEEVAGFGLEEEVQKDLYKDMIEDLEKYGVREKCGEKLDGFLEDFGRMVEEDLPRSVIHNDLDENHIFVADGRLSGVIDFSDAGIGDPALDFAQLWAFGREFVEKVYGFYGGAKDEKFLWRSLMYVRRCGVWGMIESFSTGRCDWETEMGAFERFMGMEVY